MDSVTLSSYTDSRASLVSSTNPNETNVPKSIADDGKGQVNPAFVNEDDVSPENETYEKLIDVPELGQVSSFLLKIHVPVNDAVLTIDCFTGIIQFSFLVGFHRSWLLDEHRLLRPWQY